MSDASVGLFDNERETTLDSSVAMIEDVLIELGHFLNDCRRAVPGTAHAWLIKKGSAQIGITIVDRPEFWHLRVAAVVMTADEQVDAPLLFKHLLRLNAEELHGAAFGLRGDRVVLVSERSTRDLDRSEVLDIVKRVQNYADDYDDKLVEQFGGAMGSPTDDFFEIS
jgi:hypothetical protein